MPELGRLAVCLALLCALVSVIVSVRGALTRRGDLIRAGEHAAYAVFGLVALAVVLLLRALLSHDFSLEYVAAYSSSTLPTNYVVAALWGGQKGSLLFWTFMLSLFTAIVQWQNRERNRDLMPWVTATLMTVAVFFLGLVTFITDHVRAPADAGDRGRRPEPVAAELLDDDPPAVALHRLRERVGSVRVRDGGPRHRTARRPVDPQHAALGALLVVLPEPREPVRRDVGLRGARLGRVLGVGSGRERRVHAVAGVHRVLHSVMIQEKKDMLRVWNMVLVLLTFSLTIFGTFLTRSGVISSVHSFTQSGLGPFFIGFLLLVILVAGGLVAYRLPELRTSGTIESFFSREAAFLFNNLILVGIAFSVFWGTVFPVISEWVRGVKITVGPPFFNPSRAVGSSSSSGHRGPSVARAATAQPVANFFKPVGTALVAGGVMLAEAVGRAGSRSSAASSLARSCRSSRAVRRASMLHGSPPRAIARNRQESRRYGAHRPSASWHLRQLAHPAFPHRSAADAQGGDECRSDATPALQRI
jgi:cytochrome c-type biogenesis protein CcmF